MIVIAKQVMKQFLWRGSTHLVQTDDSDKFAGYANFENLKKILQ